KVLVYASTLSVLLIVLSISSGGYFSAWAMIGVGLCNSVMFAIIFSLSVKGLGHYTTRASGLLSSAIVGGAVIPYLQGMLIDWFSWGIAFLVPAACYIYIIFFALNGYKSRSAYV